LSPVRKDGKWGFINASGEIVIPLQFERARTFFNFSSGSAWSDSNSFAWVGTRNETEDEHFGNSGFINRKGEIVIPLEYDRIQYISTVGNVSYFWVQQNGLWGIYAISETAATSQIPDTNPPTGITIFPAGIVITAALTVITAKRRKRTENYWIR
jgi:hypothetical protein